MQILTPEWDPGKYMLVGTVGYSDSVSGTILLPSLNPGEAWRLKAPAFFYFYFPYCKWPLREWRSAVNLFRSQSTKHFCRLLSTLQVARLEHRLRHCKSFTEHPFLPRVILAIVIVKLVLVHWLVLIPGAGALAGLPNKPAKWPCVENRLYPGLWVSGSLSHCSSSLRFRLDPKDWIITTGNGLSAMSTSVIKILPNFFPPIFLFYSPRLLPHYGYADVKHPYL